MDLLSKLKPDTSRPFTYSGNGLIKVYLHPKKSDELNAKLKAVVDKHAAACTDANRVRDLNLAAAKTTYANIMKEINDKHGAAWRAANAAYERAETELLCEYSKPLTPEALALLDAKVDHVVRMKPA